MKKIKKPPQNSIIDKATTFCILQKKRLTEPRMEVLKIVAKSRTPLGAYEILEKLGKVIKSPKPPTVYRAIDFWLQNGFVHRIESLNAYVVCQTDCGHRGSQFMICDDCGLVIEIPVSELPKVLRDGTAQNTFAPSSWNVEVHGLCSLCQ